MPANFDVYRQTLIDLYLRLPDTPHRLSRFDLRLVRQFWERQVPLPVVEMAFWLASARRAARPAHVLPLGLICSLHYFLPLSEELLVHPLPQSYLAYRAARSPRALPPVTHPPPWAESQLAQPASVQIYSLLHARRQKGPPLPRRW